MYEWALADMGKLDGLAAFIYAVGAGLWLARFNTQAANADKRYFTACQSGGGGAGQRLHLVLHSYGIPWAATSASSRSP